MSDIKIKQKAPHSEMAGPHEPIFTGHAVWLNKNGVGTGKYGWAVLCCNIPDCEYRLIVEEFSLAAYLADLATRS